MNHQNHDAFERDLRRDLSALAAGCPAGPSPDAVLSRLRRRTARRRFVSGLGAAAAALVAIAIALRAQPTITAPQPMNQAAHSITKAADVAAVKAVTPDQRSPIAVAPSTREEPDDAAWPSYPPTIALALAQQSPTELVEGNIEWDVSLSLRLAAAGADEVGAPVIRLTSPSWR